MLIRLDPEQTEPLAWDEEQSLGADAVDPALGVEIGPVRCQGSLRYVSPGFLLDAGLRYHQRLTCTRCLEPFEEDVESHLELLVVQSAPATPGVHRETELDADDLSTVLVEGETLDTEPLVVDHVNLLIPMKPLCREDCLGLCPRCGANRNLEPDCCPETGYDERWSALAGLRDGLRGSDPEN